MSLLFTSFFSIIFFVKKSSTNFNVLSKEGIPAVKLTFLDKFSSNFYIFDILEVFSYSIY
jgi:hypothetical protein